MKRKNKNKFWIILTICFCGILAAAPLLAVAGTSGGDKQSSSDIFDSNVNNEVGDIIVEALYSDDREDVIYSDNNIRDWNEELPSIIKFYGQTCGGVKYQIKSDLGLGKVNVFDLSAEITIINSNDQREQESLGYVVSDFLEVYFDFGCVTFIQKKFDVETEFNVKIFCISNPNVYVDVLVIFTTGMVFEFDNPEGSSNNCSWSFYQHLRDCLSNSICRVGGDSALYEWPKLTKFQERLDSHSVYTIMPDGFSLEAYTSEARYAEVVFEDVVLSDDCILLACNNMGGSVTDFVEVVNVPGQYSVWDTIPDWEYSDEVCSDGWGESYTGIVLWFWFEYDPYACELHLFIIVDSEYDQLDIWNLHTLSGSEAIYVYQERVLESLDFLIEQVRTKHIDSDPLYGCAQGSIGWYGGKYRVES